MNLKIKIKLEDIMTWFSLESLDTEPLKNISWFLENSSHGRGIVDALYSLHIEVSGNSGTAPHLTVKETTYGGKKKFEVMPQSGYGSIFIRANNEVIKEGVYEQEIDGCPFIILPSRLGGSRKLGLSGQ